MAFSKALIKGLFPDATDEQLKSLQELHMESVVGEQKKREAVEAELDKLKDIKEQFDNLKKNSISKEEHQKVVDEFDAYKSQQAAEKDASLKTEAYRQMLKDAGVKEKYIDMLIENSGNTIESIRFDADGKVVDAEKMSESMKERYSEFIGIVGQQGAANPTPPGSNGMDADKFKALPLHEQMRYANEHPESISWI